jgi:hypothetical protein
MPLVTGPETDWLTTLTARLDPALLEPVIRDVLHRADATVTDFDARPVDYTNVDPDRRLLVRITGGAVIDGGSARWSVVLKAFRRPTEEAPPNVDEPSHYDYWEREPKFFESGLWSEIGPGIRSVRCHGVRRWPDDEVWLWLEDLVDEHATHWPDDAFEHAAHDFGRFAGSFVAGRALPTEPWLADTRSVQAQYSIANPWMRAEILPVLDAPPSAGAAAAFGSARDRFILRDAFRRQDALLQAIDRLPRALCHNDTGAPNLFVRRSGTGSTETVAIDWAIAGIGPAGGDLGQLVAGSACFFRTSTDRLDALDRLTTDAYRAGLADVGATISAADVRLASLVTVLAQWTAIVALHLGRALDPKDAEWVARFWRRPANDVVEQFTPLLAFLTRRAEETLRLAKDA